MFHLAGFFEDVDQGGALLAIAAMADQALNTNGDDLTVPRDLNFLAGLSLLTAATTVTSAQVRAPSLLDTVYQDLSTIVLADDYTSPPALDLFPQSPRQLIGDEDLQFWTNTDHAAAIEIQGLVWLADGPLSPVTGQIFTVRATGASALAQGTWINSNLTLSQTLPVGEYQIVGMRAEGANLQAARLSFTGGGYRPGCPGSNGYGDVGEPLFRYGRLGSWGQFSSTALPSLDCLGITDTAQDVFLDLIKVG